MPFHGEKLKLPRRVKAENVLIPSPSRFMWISRFDRALWNKHRPIPPAGCVAHIIQKKLHRMAPPSDIRQPKPVKHRSALALLRVEIEHLLLAIQPDRHLPNARIALWIVDKAELPPPPIGREHPAIRPRPLPIGSGHQWREVITHRRTVRDRNAHHVPHRKSRIT